MSHQPLASPAPSGITGHGHLGGSGFPSPAPTEQPFFGHAAGAQDDGRTFSTGGQTFTEDTLGDLPSFKRDDMLNPGGGAGPQRASSVLSAPFSHMNADDVDEIHGVGFSRG